MSRYYRIEVTPGSSTIATSTVAQSVWTNFVSGQADLGAQQIEFDIPVQRFDAPMGQAFVRIWGPSKEQLSQASDFNGASIKVYAGMQNGLPLASATVADGQQGLLLSGDVYQAFGNNQGINQTLDFVVQTDGGATQSQPANLVVDWKKGQPMATAIYNALSVAYPDYMIKVDIDDRLVLTQDEAHVCETIQQFATYARNVSLNILGGTYAGVGITLKDRTITVDDGTADIPNTITIKTQDLIGQVTWLNAYTIQFNCVMRSDIECNTVVVLPTLAGLQAVTTANSASNVRAQNAFSGNWTVILARHIGNSRAPDANSWISTYQAISNTASQAAISVSDSSA